MVKRRFIEANFKTGILKINSDDNQQSIAATFLCNLVLPFIESYWMTLAFFIAGGTKQQHDADTVCNMIQWQTESIYETGKVLFYESCMQDPIKNALKRFTQMGILETKKVQLKKTVFKTYYVLSEKTSEEAIDQFYHRIIAY